MQLILSSDKLKVQSGTKNLKTVTFCPTKKVHWQESNKTKQQIALKGEQNLWHS